MMKQRGLLFLAPLCLATVAACGTGTAGSTGAAGSTGTAGSTGAAGTTGTGGTTGSSGAAGDTSGAAGDQGTGGSATGAAGDQTGAAGDQGAAGSTTGTGGSIGAGTAGTTGTGGTMMSTGAAGSTGAGGGVVLGTKPSGMSTGCTMPPASDDSQSKFILRNIHITTPLDPVYLAGGAVYKNQNLPNGGYDYQYRPYAIRLPKNYDPTKAYAITFGGGGCGGSASGFASGPNGGQQLDDSQSTIQIGLSYLAGCFDDGGSQIDDRSDTPEEPYFRAVLAEVESKYCVDKGQVFISGYSSGGWESYTLGCAVGDLIRGIGADEGGLRVHRPTCKGPVAAYLVAGELDTTNPIGPLAKIDSSEDSFGSAPGRDDLLMRNGCVSSNYVFTYTDVNGSAPHTQFDTKTYTACVKYTGCPAAYPVVWCPLPNAGHNDSSIGNLNYSPGAAWSIFSTLPTP